MVTAMSLAPAGDESQNLHQPNNQSLRIARARSELPTQHRLELNISQARSELHIYPEIPRTYNISPRRRLRRIQHRSEPNTSSTGPHHQPSNQSIRFGRRVLYQTVIRSEADGIPVQNQIQSNNLPGSSDPSFQGGSTTSPDNCSLSNALGSFEPPPPRFRYCVASSLCFLQRISI